MTYLFCSDPFESSSKEEEEEEKGEGGEREEEEKKVKKKERRKRRKRKEREKARRGELYLGKQKLVVWREKRSGCLIIRKATLVQSSLQYVVHQFSSLSTRQKA